MFTDLNKHALKTSNSLAELYDSRDLLAVATREVISEIDFLNTYVDKEKDNLGKYSASLFTLNIFYSANKKILRRKECDEDFKEFLKMFWGLVVKYMVPWNDLISKELSKTELREQYIAAQGVVIKAFGRVGGYLFEHDEYELDQYLPKIINVNWKRNAVQWKRRVIGNNGRMITNSNAVLLAGNVIKNYMELPLTEDEKNAEDKFMNN